MNSIENRKDMFGSLHAEIESPIFIKEETTFRPDEDGLSYESDIVDIADLISKTDLPLDISNIQPTSLDSTSSQNLCDVIHQLHGDQQQERSQALQKLSSRNLQINARNHELSSLHQPKHILSNNFQSALIQNATDFEKTSQGVFNKKCPVSVSNQMQLFNSLPDSPPDSGSEPYSPPQEGKNAVPENFLQRISGFNFNAGQIMDHFNTTPPYENSPTQKLDSKLNLDSRIILTSPISNSYTTVSEPQYTTINPSQLGLYSDGDGNYDSGEQAKSVSTLSPVSNISDTSIRSNSNSSFVGAPASKKRKHTESPSIPIPNQLSTTILKQHYKFLVQQTIKQEPGLSTSPTSSEGRNAFVNEAFEISENKVQSNSNGSSSSSTTVRLPAQQHPLLGGNKILVETRTQESSAHTSKQTPLTTGLLTPHFTDSNSTYQVIKWASFHPETWASLYDVTGKELKTVTYRVDADKGFNFAVADDTFVCQKKNHFQVTVHIGVVGHPYYVKTEEGLKPLESFFINLYGVKYESQNQTISIEQSQSDRSKKPFHPVKVDLPGDQVTKVTIGRLHFSETTTNNMRKKGRPNPDQRYFLCIVALHAHAGGKTYTVAGSATEKIIVRASNPGQFDQDDIQWQRGQVSDAIFHNGKVGINYDHPDEALVVHGNMKLTGHLMQPSDKRAKQDIEEVDTSAQLKNVQNIRLCKYKYSPEYATYAGIDSNREETGVIAQEFAEVMPDAVKETGEVRLPNGEVISNFLVVDKDRLYMENVGAVKELCKVTGGFEERIDELERWNKKLSKLKTYDSVRSKTSRTSDISSISRNSRQGSEIYFRSTRENQNNRGRKPFQADKFCCFNKRYTSAVVVFLLILMTVCITAIGMMYIKAERHITELSKTQSQVLTMGTSQFSANNTAPSTSQSFSVNGQGTTQPPLPRDANNPKPITYCASGEVVCFIPSPMYCCSTPDVGAPSETLCPDGLQTGVFKGLKPDHPNAIPDAPRVQIHFPTRKDYEPKYHSVNGKFKHPSTHHFRSGVDNDVINQQAKALKYRLAHIGRKIPSQKNRIDPNYDMTPGYKKRIPRSLVKRSTNPNVLVKEITLVEPNVTLYNRSAEYQPYFTCSVINQSFTFNLPISHATPPSTPMTLRFSLTEKAKVVLCSVPSQNVTPCSLSISSDESTSILASQRGYEANFELYLSNYVEGDYAFRVAAINQDPSVICEYAYDDLGGSYLAYNFHVYRVCPNRE